ncbi:homogentisate 1,2-dioxygenase-like isoform X3 [Lineus longissimus]|uniref:homogentisate 1,2-dioxygenase-like isoform X3 n=1 Tax=Lineus longissimus TaxID=88925 RepID=UPI00315D4813
MDLLDKIQAKIQQLTSPDVKDYNLYLTGFGNEFSSEDPRCPGALSKTQNNPQKCNYGLYAEQLTGSAFTSPRNQRSWLYRIRPSVCHTPFKRIRQANFTNDWLDDFPNPNQPVEEASNHPTVKFSNGPFDAKKSESETQAKDIKDSSQTTNWKETIAGDLKQSAKETTESNTPGTSRKVLAKAHYYDRGTEPAKEPKELHKKADTSTESAKGPRRDPPQKLESKPEKKSPVKNLGFDYEFEPDQPKYALSSELRWHPFDVPKKEEKEVDFVRGLATLCGAGDPRARNGVGVHVYLCNISMGDRCFYNSDGDFLIVPQQGVLHLVTEFGKMQVSPGEICVLQQGIRFNVAVEGESRGYIMEVFNSHFELPNLGVVGANGLASPRHFLTPVAWYEDRDNVTYSVITKFQGALFMADQNHSPFDVVAWHGNYAPFKYNLKNFQVMGSVSFDTPDSSLYTVLTCPSRTPGIPAASFTICPPRWHCAEKTFKKPYFHRSAMSEVIGLLYGQYEGKNSKFRPGGACLHGMMSAHGPDTETYEKGASTNDVKPARIGDGSLAFKFESSFSMSVTKWGNEACNKVDHEYFLCWQNMKRNFNPDDKPDEGELAPLSNKSTHEPMSLASPNRSKASRGIFPYGPQVPSGSQD